MTVHNHNPDEGAGTFCPETRMADGSLRGRCLGPDPTGCAVCDELDTDALGWVSAWYEVHRSMHTIKRETWDRMIERLAR